MTYLIGLRKYIAPDIVLIKLDNEISLALESTPPEGPNEVYNITPTQFNNNPFNNKMV